jgi:hypothetical protein
LLGGGGVRARGVRGLLGEVRVLRLGVYKVMWLWGYEVRVLGLWGYGVWVRGLG